MRLPEPTNLARFEQAILPHLAAAYNLARWLTRDEHNAEDVVQDVYVRALTFFDSFHGGNSRAWLPSALSSDAKSRSSVAVDRAAAVHRGSAREGS